MAVNTKRRILLLLAAVPVLLLFAVAALYAWPLDDDGLRPPAQELSYAEATARIAATAQREENDPAIRPECRSQALLHGERTAKAVLLLHGYHDCTAQQHELAARFYAAGYNVYVPLAPRHGNVDPDTDADLNARELAVYAGAAMDVVAALGEDAGVAGHSGGAVLATHLTTTRPQQVSHLLAIAPFYRPASAQAPAFAIKPMIVTFGFGLVPDHVNSQHFSYAALAQYLRLAAVTDTGQDLPRLSSVAVVTSPNDTLVDLPTARRVPAEIAAANELRLGRFEIPASTGIAHDSVEAAELGSYRDDLYRHYLSLYEGS